VADSSSAAARAAALQAPPRPAQPDGNSYEREEPEPKRHPVRTSLLLLVLLGVLGGGLWLGYRYTQHQYYVGATESGQLAIFRGVPGQIAGLDLSSVNETSSAKLSDLTTVAQERVKQGIQADSQPDAKQRLAALIDPSTANPNLKPLCPTPDSTESSLPPAATPTPSAPAPPGSTAASTAPASLPAITPDAQPSDTASPATDPVGCRPVD
jgi:protein phosphatase